MQTEKDDYYQLLGVRKDAEHAEIRKAFKRLAMEYHPDRNPGNREAEEKFKAIAEAHEVLSDPEKRALYDQYGHAGPRQAGFEGFGGMGVEDLFSHFADLFGGMGGGFGFGRRGGARAQQGEDLQLEMTITLAEAARGCQRTVEAVRLIHCRSCGGSGAKAGTQPVTCHSCAGRGQVATHQGFLTIATTCPTCRGSGRMVREKCIECHGGGLVRHKEMLTVNVPAGIDEGQTLRVPGRGQAGPSGGPPGNLYVTFQVEPDPRFEREGDNLHTFCRLTYAQAVLGAQVKVATLDGEIEVKVEPGTQPGTMKVLRGAGMPNVHGRGKGDLAIRFTVVVPQKLDGEQRQLIEALRRFDPADGSAQSSAESEGRDEEEGGFLFRRKKKKKR